MFLATFHVIRILPVFSYIPLSEYMLWFNVILGSIFIFSFVLFSLSYITIYKKKRKIKIEPRIKFYTSQHFNTSSHYLLVGVLLSPVLLDSNFLALFNFYNVIFTVHSFGTILAIRFSNNRIH